ncbi:MAG: ankyrin repeat domain-containing protein [Opitutaceae bacterium]|nr:ankyrin repeat domain-containing protein [Opitutaceae bacterium]
MDIETMLAYAREGRLLEVPHAFLTSEHFRAKGENGRTLLQEAAFHGHLDQIPAEFLTNEAIQARDADGCTLLHIAASGRQLAQPVLGPFLNRANLFAPDKRGMTVFHHAANAGALPQIHRGLLTEEALLFTDQNGWTVLHEAAAYGHLDQIPERFLTQSNLTRKDASGRIAVSVAAAYGHLVQVPEGVRRSLNLIGEGRGGDTSAEIAILEEHEKRGPHIILTKDQPLADKTRLTDPLPASQDRRDGGKGAEPMIRLAEHKPTPANPEIDVGLIALAQSLGTPEALEFLAAVKQVGESRLAKVEAMLDLGKNPGKPQPGI